MMIVSFLKLSGNIHGTAENCGIYGVSMLLTASAGTVAIFGFSSSGTFISGLLVSIAACAVALRIMYDGKEPECLLILSITAPCMGYCVLGLIGTADEITPLAAASLALLAAGLALIRKKNVIPALSCILCAVMIMLFIIAGLNEACVIGSAVMVAGTAVTGIGNSIRDSDSLAKLNALTG